MLHLFFDKSHHARVLAIDNHAHSPVILAHFPYSISMIESAVFEFQNEDTRLKLTLS